MTGGDDPAWPAAAFTEGLQNASEEFLKQQRAFAELLGGLDRPLDFPLADELRVGKHLLKPLDDGPDVHLRRDLRDDSPLA